MNGMTQLEPLRRKVAVVIGATSKWQGDGRNTRFAHGEAIDESSVAPSARWGAGGAISLKLAQEGYFVVITSRQEANARPLAEAVTAQGSACMIVELDLTSEQSISAAFAKIRADAGSPEIVICNAGYMDGRELPAAMELLENFPVALFDNAMHIAARGPFLIAKEVLPDMRKAGFGSLFFSNNPLSYRGKMRKTGESLYYPRVMTRHLAQVLTEEYSQFGVHIANVVIDGLIDSPGTRKLSGAATRPEIIMDPMRIADAFYYLHMQHPSCWSHEIQLTPFAVMPSY